MGKAGRHIRKYGIVMGLVLLINIVYNFSFYTSGKISWVKELSLLVLLTTVGYLGFRGLNHFFLQRVLNWKMRTERSFMVFILVSALFGALLIGGFMKLNVYIFREPEPSGDAYVKNMLFSAILFLLFTLGATFGQFLARWKQGIEESARMGQLLARSQLESLKNQVNPHFLFNALNTLTTLIREDEEQAVHFVRQLSRILRYSLLQEGEEAVTIQTELRVAASFMGICQQRFQDKLVFETDLPDSLLQRRILTHSLLMLLENAMKHNEISRKRPLHIRIRAEESWLVVENSNQPRQTTAPSNQIGLANITGRYRGLTTLPVIVDSDAAWWRVKIPLIDRE